MAPFVDLLDGARPLVSHAARARLLEAMAPYAALEPDVAFECHFGDARGRVDLVIRLRPADRDAMLAASDRSGVAPAVHAFLESWARDEDLAAMPFVELEIDLDGAPPRDPWIGPCVEPLLADGIGAITRAHHGVPATRWPSARLAAAVLRRLGVGDEAWQARLLALYEALPSGGCIGHLTWLGARPSRSGAASIHLIASLPGSHALGYLRTIGWRGDLDALGRLLRRHFAHATRVDLDLDADLDGAANGTACYAAFPAPRPGDTGLARSLDALRDDGLLDGAAVEDLRAWVAAVTPRERWTMTLKTILRGTTTSSKVYLEATGR